MSIESRRDLLQVIDEESDRLNRFIEGLSGADRPDASEGRSVRVVQLGDIVREALTRSNTVLRRHHIEVAIDDSVPALAVDRAAIAEVLYILLDNASKYTPPGTSIQICASSGDSHYVRVTVLDEGPGIPPELRETVFQKFFRIPASEPIDPRRTGIGLGLPIARRLVESQAGRIWIESPASGCGTLVVMMLPEGAENRSIEPLDTPAAAQT
jgi:two-component system sensor histidine kinase KdpD